MRTSSDQRSRLRPPRPRPNLCPHLADGDTRGCLCVFVSARNILEAIIIAGDVLAVRREIGPGIWCGGPDLCHDTAVLARYSILLCLCCRYGVSCDVQLLGYNVVEVLQTFKSAFRVSSLQSPTSDYSRLERGCEPLTITMIESHFEVADPRGVVEPWSMISPCVLPH